MVEREERIVERDAVRGPERDPGRGLMLGLVAALLVAGLIVVLILAVNDDDDNDGGGTEDIELEVPDVEVPDDIDVNVDDDGGDTEE